jgi:uncharacterized protein
MLSVDVTAKPWAVTPEKIADAVRRMVEAQVADRYQEMLRLRRVLRGLLMPIDLIVTSQALYDSRAQVPGTVEFAARTQGRVLYAGD